MDEKLAAYCSPFASISNFTVKNYLGVLMLLLYENGQQVNCDKIGFLSCGRKRNIIEQP